MTKPPVHETVRPVSWVHQSTFGRLLLESYAKRMEDIYKHPDFIRMEEKK